jgi:hypothetical protein
MLGPFRFRRRERRPAHGQAEPSKRYRRSAGEWLATTCGREVDVATEISGIFERYCCPVTSITAQSAKTSMALKRSSIVVPQSYADRTKSIGPIFRRTMRVMAGRPRKDSAGSLLKSVAIVADTDAHTRNSHTNTSIFIVTPALDITLTRSVAVGITGLADNDTTFTAFTPAAAVFIANHANVLNIALRCG